MMRNSNKISSSLQKTYDECFLLSSTAVYFEGQANEGEALRKWKTVDDRITEFNAYGLPSGYRARSETERALQESLKEMHLQAQERINLLDALKQSRAENPIEGRKSDGLGNGTVRPVQYSELPRSPAPNLPSLPPRPPPRPSIGNDISYRPLSSQSLAPSPAISPSPYAAPAPTLPASHGKQSRTPSPNKDKREGGGLRMTLRDGKDKKKDGKSRTSGHKKQSGVAAAKAASQAWTTKPSFGSGGLEQSLGSQGGSSVSLNTGYPQQRTSMEMPSSTQATPGDENPYSPRKFSSDFGEAAGSYRPVSQQYDRDPSGQTSGSRPYSYIPQGERYSMSSEPTQSQGHSSKYAAFENLSVAPAKAGSGPSLQRSSAPDIPSKPDFRPAEYQPYRPPVPPPPRSSRLSAQTPSSKPQNRTEPERRSDAKPSELQGRREITRKAVANSSSPRTGRSKEPGPNISRSSQAGSSTTGVEKKPASRTRKRPPKAGDSLNTPPSSSDSENIGDGDANDDWQKKATSILESLPRGVDDIAAKQILNEVVIQGDEVHWDDVAGLDIAKNALKEAVVYPFLRPDLFMGLREPARGMLLFGPPGTGKTMLARAVATESKSTFFSISASSLTSKYLGESEKLVRALFSLAKALAPSIIFVDEIDSLLSTRSGSGEHEATRRIKTEFLIQWSDLQRAAAGSKQSSKDMEKGDPSRVLVLAATNLPWAIDEAARRRFVRRQYIPLPEDWVREKQIRTLIGHQNHSLRDREIKELVRLTDGYSGSDITALAKDAAMGPLRSLGEALLHMNMDQIPAISSKDFKASLVTIRPSVSKEGLQQFEDWAKEFGERGG